MRTYRANEKIVVIQAYADTNPEPQAKTVEKIAKVQKQTSITEQRRSGRESRQVDMSIIKKKEIVKPNIYKQVVPKWKKDLPENATEVQNRMLVLMTNKPVVKWLIRSGFVWKKHCY